MSFPEEGTTPIPEVPPAPEPPPPPAEDWRDRYLRALAELDNYRKRMERERESQRAYASEELLRALLPLLDALESSLGAEGDVASLRQGVRLALGEAMRLLAEKGLEPIDAVDRPFDPRIHEACGILPDATRAPGTVVRELRRGYRFRDRLLRASRVQVTVAPPTEDAEKAADPAPSKEG